MVFNQLMSTTITNTANGTPIARTTEGSKIAAADLAAGMELFNTGMGWWNKVEGVKAADRWGKITVDLGSHTVRMLATKIVTVK